MGLYSASASWGHKSDPRAFATDWEHKPAAVRVRHDALAVHSVLLVYLILAAVLVGFVFGLFWSVLVAGFGVALLAADFLRHRLEFDYPFVRHTHVLGFSHEDLRASLVRVTLARDWFGADEHALVLATRDGRFVVNLGATQHGDVWEHAGLRKLMDAISAVGGEVDEDVRRFLEPRAPLTLESAARAVRRSATDAVPSASRSGRSIRVRHSLFFLPSALAIVAAFCTIGAFDSDTSAGDRIALAIAAPICVVAAFWLWFAHYVEVVDDELVFVRYGGLATTRIPIVGTRAEVIPPSFWRGEMIGFTSDERQFRLSLAKRKETYCWPRDRLIDLLMEVKRHGGVAPGAVFDRLRRDD